MIKYFQDIYGMSRKGAQDLLHAIIGTIFMDFSFMLPLVFAFTFLEEYIDKLGLAGHQTFQGILSYSLMTVLFIIVMYTLTYFQYNLAYTKVYEESERKRLSLAETLRKLPLSYFAHKDLSDLSATIMDDTTQIETIFSHAVPQLYAAIITTTVFGIMLFLYNWKLSLAIFWVVPLTILTFSLSRKFQRKTHEETFYTKREITESIQEGLEAIYEIKSYNREKEYGQSLNTQLDHYEKSLIHGELMMGVFINLSFIFLKLGLPSVIVVGTYLVTAHAISFFTYLVFLVVAARIYNPIMAALEHFAALLYLRIRIQRMKEISSSPKQIGINDFHPQGYDITFKSVCFSYEKDVNILNNVSFQAKQGEVTALVGPSGGGKSTVAKLAARFWDIDTGKIELGGVDISQINTETLLHDYSIVFQDVTLFNASIIDNIRLGKEGATDKEVIQAARLAQCDGFIRNLPQGYHTHIGENGEKLSGGERQRISIARAILKDAPIILLDEATASLDAENESNIQQALSELIKHKTVLIIAHRMRTVLGADKIIVLKDGQIVETGTPEKLQHEKGLFASMLQKQQEV